jgi:hypothetical protein
MTPQHDLDEILRRALHAEVDSVDPPGDGLTHIRQRLARPKPRLHPSLLLADAAELWWLTRNRLEPLVTRARAILVPALAWLLTTARAAASSLAARAAASSRAARSAGGGNGGDSRPRQGAAHRSQPAGRFAALVSPAMSWLRPALVVAAAVVIVVAGVVTLSQLQQTVTGVSLFTGGGQSTPASPTAGAAGSNGSQAPHPSTPSPGVSATSALHGRKHHATPSPTCSPGAAGGTGASAGPTASPTPTVTPTVTPTPTDSVTPTPTSSGTTAPPSSAPATPAVGSSPAHVVTCKSPLASRPGPASGSPSP